MSEYNFPRCRCGDPMGCPAHDLDDLEFFEVHADPYVADWQRNVRRLFALRHKLGGWLFGFRIGLCIGLLFMGVVFLVLAATTRGGYGGFMVWMYAWLGCWAVAALVGVG